MNKKMIYNKAVSTIAAAALLVLAACELPVQEGSAAAGDAALGTVRITIPSGGGGD